MRKWIGMVFPALFGVSVLTSASWADEEKVPLDKVPAAVKKAIKAKFPKAEIEEVVKEEEDDSTIYEVEIEVGEDELTVSLKKDGTILEIEKEIDVDDLPAVVIAAVKKKYPKATIKEAEEVIDVEEDEMTYELVLQDGKKTRKVSVEVKAEIEDEDEKEELSGHVLIVVLDRRGTGGSPEQTTT